LKGKRNDAWSTEEDDALQAVVRERGTLNDTKFRAEFNAATSALGWPLRTVKAVGKRINKLFGNFDKVADLRRWSTEEDAALQEVVRERGMINDAKFRADFNAATSALGRPPRTAKAVGKRMNKFFSMDVTHHPMKKEVKDNPTCQPRKINAKKKVKDNPTCGVKGHVMAWCPCSFVAANGDDMGRWSPKAGWALDGDWIDKTQSMSAVWQSNHPVISFLYWLQEEAQKDVLGRDRLLHFCFEETAHEIIAGGCMKAHPSPCNKRKASACFMCGTLSLCSLTQGFLTLIKHHLKRHNQEPKGRLFAFVESMPEGGQSRPSEFQDLPPDQSLRGSTNRTRQGNLLAAKRASAAPWMFPQSHWMCGRWEVSILKQCSPIAALPQVASPCLPSLAHHLERHATSTTLHFHTDIFPHVFFHRGTSLRGGSDC
jgi:hypothetical protein